MLSLGRTSGQYIVIGDEIIVQVVSINGMLRLAIEAPKDVRIVRGEVYEKDHPRPAILEKEKSKITKNSII